MLFVTICNNIVVSNETEDYNMKKLENKINNLFARVKEIGLTDYEIGLVNHMGLLYSVGRANVLQVCALLTALMIQHERNLEEIKDLLK